MNNKSKLIFKAEYTNPDGEVTEYTVDVSDLVKKEEVFDFSSKEAFLKTFDSFEKDFIESRNEFGKEVAEGLLQAAAKKKDRVKKQDCNYGC